MANLLTGQTKEGGQKIIRKSETGSTEQTRRKVSAKKALVLVAA